MDDGQSNADTTEFWNDVWDTAGSSGVRHDALLADTVSGLIPGRALEIGCGIGGNAIWLAEQGWQVTALDFSNVAIKKAKERAADHGVDVEFITADASTYKPTDQYNLVISFYIQLPPEQRARMLSNAAATLAPGGKLLFVSHDVSAPPTGWNADDLRSLTEPDQVASELPGLRIKQAAVIEDTGAHMEHMPDPDEDHNHTQAEITEVNDHHSHGGSTVVVAVKPNGSG